MAVKVTEVVVLNRVTPDGANEIIYLSLSTKTQIINQIKQCLRSHSPDALGLASDIQDNETLARDMLTLSEWLERERITLDKSAFHRLANIVARKYREATGAAPRTITRPDARGNWRIKANGFRGCLKRSKV